MTLREFDRRHMLSALGTGMLAGTVAGTLAKPSMAFAAIPASSKLPGNAKLLFVMLRGAADGLAMLAPTGDPGFERLRGAHAGEYADAQKADGLFTIHPAFEQIGKAYSGGEATFVHAAATSYRERSHFDGQNLLETGAAVPYATTQGWLNRLTALAGEEHGTPLPRALAIAPGVPLALRGPAPASSYAPSTLPPASQAFLDRVTRLYADDEQLGGLWAQALATREMAGEDNLRNLRDADAAGNLAAKLMRDKDGADIGMIEISGWDSHANQPGQFRRQARQLDTLMGAYKSGMGSAWGQTMVIVATEFGRTAALNGTNGTDHGTGGAAIVLGGNLKGGKVIADWPGLRAGDLYQERDLKPTIALESVLAGAVSEHLRLDPVRAMAQLFPGRKAEPLGGWIKG